MIAIDSAEWVAMIKDHLNINEMNLASEFVRQPSLLSYWMTQYEVAADQHRRLELDLDIFEAVARDVARVDMETNQEKTSDKKIESSVHTLEEYKARRRHLLAVEHNREVIKSTLEAIREKGRMLLTLGALRRAEIESNIIVNRTRN